MAEELRNDPAVDAEMFFPPKPFQSVTSAEGSSKKVELVQDLTPYHGELEKLVYTRAVSTPWDETRALTSTKRARHQLNIGVLMFSRGKFGKGRPWGWYRTGASSEHHTLPLPTCANST